MVKTVIKYSSLTFIILLLVIIFFSPYKQKDGFKEKAITTSIVIDSSVEKVYRYLGNSDNAKDWSVYVDHITPLNNNIYKDGTKGSKRMCFQNKNEEGIVWEEEVLIDIKNKCRRLNIYNMKGFSLMADHLITEQLYSEENGKCKLSFTLFFEKGKSSYIEEIKMYYAAFIIANVFEGNLGRVKVIIESSKK